MGEQYEEHARGLDDWAEKRRALREQEAAAHARIDGALDSMNAAHRPHGLACGVHGGLECTCGAHGVTVVSCVPCAPLGDALDKITELLDGMSWNADTVDAIADIVRSTGRTVRDVNGLGGGDVNPHGAGCAVQDSQPCDCGRAAELAERGEADHG